MTGKRYGYARVSTDDQTTATQIGQLEAAGCNVIVSESASGKSIDGRPKLKLLLEVMHAGDELYITKLDRLARNTLDMLSIIAHLGDRGIGVRALAEPWADTTTAAGRMMITFFAGMAEFERDRIRERQAEGIARVKATEPEKYRGGKVKHDVAEIRRLSQEGLRPCEIRDRLGCSESTVFRALR